MERYVRLLSRFKIYKAHSSGVKNVHLKQKQKSGLSFSQTWFIFFCIFWYNGTQRNIILPLALESASFYIKVSLTALILVMWNFHNSFNNISFEYSLCFPIIVNVSFNWTSFWATMLTNLEWLNNTFCLLIADLVEITSWHHWQTHRQVLCLEIVIVSR